MNHILNNVYPDDLAWLRPAIRLRAVNNMLVQAKIAANPHVDRAAAKEFIDTLLAEKRHLEPQKEPKMDRKKFEELRSILGNPDRFKRQ